MLDFIYTLFIAPLEYWMHAALAWGFSKTHSWGEAIIVMSLVVNFVILPIYMKAERWQEDERALRKGFEEKERMIKRVFKGQERFAMITTMHRQAGYSPFLTLRSSVGFFLQIPFFFAAYHFLSHFEPLVGVSFIGLPDLSRPDGLIHVGGFAINVMPFLMTAINLASALVYTKNLTKKDRTQLYAMAALFLVLLYDAASGLVLYWTCNNIFSFGKNVCYDIAARINLPGLLQRAGAWVRAQTFIKESHEGASGVALLTLSLWGVGTAFALLASNQTTFLSDSLKTFLSLFSDCAYIGCALFAAIELVRVKAWREHRLLLILYVILTYVILRTWVKWEFFGSIRRSFSLSAGIFFLLVSLAILNIRQPFAARLFARLNPTKTSPAVLFTPASVWLVILLTGYLPVEAYITAPEIFSATEVVLAKSLLWGAVLGLSLWALGRLAFLWRAERLAGYSVTLIALVFTAFAFLLPLDVGTIDAFQIANPAPLYRTENLCVDLAVIFLVVMLFGFAVRRGFSPQLARVISFVCVAALFAGVLGLWQSRGTWQVEESTQSTDATPELPTWNERLLGFSREGTNTVILMFDAFTGPHMREIMTEMPEVISHYKDFTWFENTIATGSFTKSSVASIFIGSDGTPGALNAKYAGKSISLEEQINEAYADTIAKLPADTDIAFNERNWLEPVRLKRALEKRGLQKINPLTIRQMGDGYLNRWVADNNTDVGRGSSDEFLLAVSLFKSVPWSGRNLIYRNGSWIEGILGNKLESLAVRAQRDWAFLSLLPEVSNAAATRSTVKFIDLEITHSPWFMDLRECAITKNPVRVIRENGVNESHLACEACSLERLGAWFEWMRHEGVWDNTNIILVSDHSAADPNQETGGKAYAPIGRPDALLLVKLAHTKGEALTVSNTPVSIANVGDWLRGAPIDTPHAERRFWQVKLSGTEFIPENVWVNKGALTDPSAWEKLTTLAN